MLRFNTAVKSVNPIVARCDGTTVDFENACYSLKFKTKKTHSLHLGGKKKQTSQIMKMENRAVFKLLVPPNLKEKGQSRLVRKRRLKCKTIRLQKRHFSSSHAPSKRFKMIVFWQPSWIDPGY